MDVVGGEPVMNRGEWVALANEIGQRLSGGPGHEVRVLAGMVQETLTSTGSNPRGVFPVGSTQPFRSLLGGTICER